MLRSETSEKSGSYKRARSPKFTPMADIAEDTQEAPADSSALAEKYKMRFGALFELRERTEGAPSISKSTSCPAKLCSIPEGEPLTTLDHSSSL